MLDYDCLSLLISLRQSHQPLAISFLSSQARSISDSCRSLVTFSTPSVLHLSLTYSPRPDTDLHPMSTDSPVLILSSESSFPFPFSLKQHPDLAAAHTYALLR